MEKNMHLVVIGGIMDRPFAPPVDLHIIALVCTGVQSVQTTDLHWSVY